MPQKPPFLWYLKEAAIVTIGSTALILFAVSAIAGAFFMLTAPSIAAAIAFVTGLSGTIVMAAYMMYTS